MSSYSVLSLNVHLFISRGPNSEEGLVFPLEDFTASDLSVFWDGRAGLISCFKLGLGQGKGCPLPSSPFLTMITFAPSWVLFLFPLWVSAFSFCSFHFNRPDTAVCRGDTCAH